MSAIARLNRILSRSARRTARALPTRRHAAATSWQSTRALIEDCVAEEDRLLDDVFARAADLSDDPLQQVLIGLKLLAELMADLPNGHPGCVIATACYQDRLFDAKVRNLIKGAMVSWRDRFRPMFAAIERRYPTDGAITAADLADTFLSVVDGAIILARAVREPKGSRPR